MRIQRGYKTELDLNNAQQTACAKHAGAARWAWNWGLARKIEAYKAGEKVPTAIDLHRQLNVLKQSEVPWMYDVSKCAPQEALRNLDVAYAHFFRRCRTGKGRPGFPRWKSKRKGIGTFRLTGAVRVFDDAVQLPRLGRLRLKERCYLPMADASTRILNAVVSERAGRWYVSVQVEREVPDPVQPDGGMVGVDLGIKTLAVVSDGTIIENPKALRRGMARLRMLSRRVSRKKKGSANRRKAILRVAKQHARVANIRRDVIHKATTMLTRTKSAIVLEDLHVAGMLKNHCLAGAVADAAPAEFRRQANYKGGWYACEIIEADRFFPSSKRHVKCGYVYAGLKLSDRTWVCGGCGETVDRDPNAAQNLLWYGQFGRNLNAYGESGAGRAETSGETALGEVGTKHMEDTLSNGGVLKW